MTPSLSDYEILRPLGVGAFGLVRLARENLSGRLVALKQSSKSRDTSQICLERDILVKASEEGVSSVVTLHAAFQTSRFFFLAMEYMEGGDLMSHLIRQQVFSLPHSRYIFRALVSAIDHIHNRLHYVHCDIKPDHVMFSRSSSDGGRFALKLLDFGLSRPLKDAPFRGISGTADYIAKEIWESDAASDAASDGTSTGWSKEVDFWSLGCVLFEMLFGGPPFSDITHNPEITRERVLNHREYLRIRNHDRPITFSCQSVLEGLLCDRKSRLDMTLLKMHAFVRTDCDCDGDTPFEPRLSLAPELAEFFDTCDPAALQQAQAADNEGAEEYERVDSFDWSPDAFGQSVQKENHAPLPQAQQQQPASSSGSQWGSFATMKKTLSRFVPRPGSFQYNPTTTRPEYRNFKLSIAARSAQVKLLTPVQPLFKEGDRYMWH